LADVIYDFWFSFFIFWAVKLCTNNWRFRVMQVDLYNGRKMVVVVFLFFSACVVFFSFSYLYDLLFSVILFLSDVFN